MVNFIVWSALLLFPLLLLYRLAKKHMWLILGPPEATPNPFSTPARKRKGVKLVTSQSERDKVLKQSFSPDKVPSSLDAVVVGSGIGGLSVAAILSKMGKKVLVLEQHDQAGGCCHTFVEKGYEFDVGIHYIGEMKEGVMQRIFLDQLTESGVEWARLEEVYDRVVLGYGEDEISKRRSFPIHAGPTKRLQALVEKFPEEEKVICKFFDTLKYINKGSMLGVAMLKLLPLAVSRFLISCGLFMRLFPALKYYQRSVTDVMNELTDNEELKAVLAYSYGDYGTVPKDASFGMQALLTTHFTHGAYYPVGGASEIAFNIIPTIEAAGGRVLVRAEVSNIIMDEANQRVVGVTVKQGHTLYDIMASTVVSGAGVFNTIKKLLPAKAVKKFGLKKQILSNIRHSMPLMSVFIGLDGTKEELGLKASNMWIFRDEHLDTSFEEYVTGAPEDSAIPPLMFLSFPSTKDPSFNDRYPGKTTCAIITVMPYRWFEQWKDERPLHRGQDYEDFKNAIGKSMWEQVVRMFPQLEGRMEYFEVGSPLSNNYYLGSQRGEVYGADHDTARFSLETIANLRPETSIPGLYLTGQDVMTCGVSGALYGGMICAMSMTRRDLMADLKELSKQIRKDLKANPKKD